MKVDFFENSCKETSRFDSRFGICDDQNGQRAYTDIKNHDKWIATVWNEQSIEVTFISIDHCTVALSEGCNDQESLCDGMLTFKDCLFLIELKEKGKGGWLPEAIKQLENTIMLLYKNHDLSFYKQKKAYACNKRFPNFRTIDNELSKRFFNTTKGFRLDAQAKIVIKE